MSFPINSYFDSYAFVLVVTVLIGFAFGFVLERAGFGRATVLAGQFYGRDMTVLKVMFTGIATATVGLLVVDALGWADVGAISRAAASFTFVGPMLVGGLLLGVGFVIAGYCPGTSVVASASGNLDGVATFLGVILGSLLYGETQGWWATFAASGNLGHVFLPDWLGVPRAVVVLGVLALALGAFVFAEWVERKLAPKTAEAPREGRARLVPVVRRGVLGTLALVSVFAFAAGGLQTTAEAGDTEVLATITPSELAERLVREPWALRIIDTRAEEEWTEARIPRSESVAEGALGDLGLGVVADRRDLVFVRGGVAADGAEAPMPPALHAYRGRVLVLEGGFAAWRAYALDESAVAAGDDLDAALFQAAYRGLLSGQAAAPPPPRPTNVVRPSGGGGGGGCN
jgi:rhodanese-related sulfurtransferase/uncharacterized membrane protein YedE/YeeE